MSFYGGKRVFVTGGSSGIGLAAAVRLARAGAHVAIAARDEKRLASALDDVKKAKSADEARIVAVQMDVASAASVDAGAARALEELGGIDIVVNNAGYAIPGYIERLTDADFDAMLQVNYLGAVRVVRAFLPHLMKQRSGAIANVTSM